jgi:hypothetical protein
MPAKSAEAKKLDTFLDKFEPAIAAEARAVLAKVRDRLPGAAELVYDNTYALVVGFSPNERPSDAVFSVVVYPRYVVLYFLNGAVLPDPAGMLKGEGKVGRHIRLESAGTIDMPAVRELMDDAIELNMEQFDAKRPRKIVIRLEAPKQRPRRPAHVSGQAPRKPLKAKPRAKGDRSR